MELQKSSEWKASVLDNFMDYFRRVIRISAQGRFKHFRAVQFRPSKYSEGGSNSLVHHMIFRARLVLKGD